MQPALSASTQPYEVVYVDLYQPATSHNGGCEAVHIEVQAESDEDARRIVGNALKDVVIEDVRLRGVA